MWNKVFIFIILLKHCHQRVRYRVERNLSVSKITEGSRNVSPGRKTLTGSNSASIRCLVILFITYRSANEIEFSGWGRGKKDRRDIRGRGEKNEKWAGKKRGSVSSCVPRAKDGGENAPMVRGEAGEGWERNGGWTRTRISRELPIENRNERRETNLMYPLAEFTAF